MAYLVFPVDNDWEVEHGLFVVYSPDTRKAAWTTFDGLDELLESDDPAEDEPEEEVTPYLELCFAIREGDDEHARELIAAGVDLNDPDPGTPPPLWCAVEAMDAEDVRRLIHYGADPNLACAEEKSTPLKHAKKLYRTFGFTPSKNRDAFLVSMMELASATQKEQFQQIKANLEEIMRLLKAAGGK